MMRLFLFRSNARGMHYGIGTYLRTLTEALLTHPGIEVFVVSYMCGDVAELTEQRISDRQTMLSVPAPNQPFEPGEAADKRYAAALVRILEPWLAQEGPKIFHFNSALALPLMQQLRAQHPEGASVGVVHIAAWQTLFEGNSAKLQGLNVLEPRTNEEYTMSLERQFYQECDRVVTVARFMKPFLTDYYGISGGKITFIPNGITPAQKPPLSVAERQELKLRLGFGAEDRIILYVGRIDEQKGVFALAEAFSKICVSHMHVRLILVGEGQFLGCLSRVHRMKGRLCFTGFIPAEELEDYYQIADVGVLPSLFEQCPYTLLEMARHRIPLIVSQIDGPTEMFGPDECRFIPIRISGDGTPGIDVDLLSSALEEILSHTVPGATDRASGKPAPSPDTAPPHNTLRVPSLSETFSARHMGAAYLRLYQELLSLQKNVSLDIT